MNPNWRLLCAIAAIVLGILVLVGIDAELEKLLAGGVIACGLGLLV